VVVLRTVAVVVRRAAAIVAASVLDHLAAANASCAVS
jgi:hypothetical protein